MQRAGSLVLRVLAVPLRAEVFPLYQAQKKTLLFWPESLNIAKYSVDLASLPSQCHTPESLVTEFSRLTTAHNPRVEQDLPNLLPLADALEANLTLLTFAQLQDLVFALTLWPEAVRTSASQKQVAEIIILSRHSIQIGQIFSTRSLGALRSPTSSLRAFGRP